MKWMLGVDAGTMDGVEATSHNSQSVELFHTFTLLTHEPLLASPAEANASIRPKEHTKLQGISNLALQGPVNYWKSVVLRQTDNVWGALEGNTDLGLIPLRHSSFHKLI